MAIIDVIKYEGDNDVFVWKHPTEDFNNRSQLIVHDSQEAVFFKDGVALDVFGPGRYQLSTENIPFLRKIMRAPSGGVSPYHCEVYFINKIDVMDMKWGTASPMPVPDPKYNVILPIGANGQFTLRVFDSRRLIARLVGTLQNFDKIALTNAFRGILIKNIKEYLARKTSEMGISFVDVNSHLNEMSAGLKELLDKDFQVYGLQLINFNLVTVFIPPTDPSFLKIKEALAKKAEMKIVGYSYTQGRTLDIYEKAASNEGGIAAPIMNAGIGLGLAANAGGKLRALKNDDLFETIPAKETESIVCPKCLTKLPHDAQFCYKCGTKIEKMYCPKCGELITYEMAFCPKCGVRLHEQN